jgi:hypothetical protein
VCSSDLTLLPARNGLEVLLVDGNQLADVHAVSIDVERPDAASPSGATVASGVVQ